MKASLNRIRRVAMGGECLAMEMCMKGCGSTGRWKEKEFIFIIILIFIKGSFKMIRYNKYFPINISNLCNFTLNYNNNPIFIINRNAVRACFNIQTVRSTPESSTLTFLRAQGHFPRFPGTSTKDNSCATRKKGWECNDTRMGTIMRGSGSRESGRAGAA
jgi:hypothetical protein